MCSIILTLQAEEGLVFALEQRSTSSTSYTLPTTAELSNVVWRSTDLCNLAILCVLLALVGCGGGSPSAPTPQIPNVAGNYAGTTTVTFPELAASVSCPTTTTVTQSGSTVNIAPLVLGGECGNLSLPVGQETIDNTGNIQGENSGTFDEPSCGRYTFTPRQGERTRPPGAPITGHAIPRGTAEGSGGFFGRDLRLSMSATSTTCLNMNLTITLTR